jgi:hypothetical protein
VTINGESKDRRPKIPMSFRFLDFATAFSRP